VLQQNPEPTKQFGITPSLIGSPAILIICRQVLPLGLLRSVWSAGHADLLVPSQLLSEWELTRPALGPLFPPRGFGLEIFFCWRLLALPAGQRRPSWVVVGHLFALDAQAGPRLGTAAAWHVPRERMMCSTGVKHKARGPNAAHHAI